MSIIEFDHPYIPGASNSTTGPTLEGKVGFYSGNGGSNWIQQRFQDKPALCLKLRGSWQWVPLSSVSANKFKIYRENIESHYGLLYKKYLGGKKRIKKLKENVRENADEALMAHLWSSYDPRIQRDLMQEILNQFHKSTFSK